MADLCDFCDQCPGTVELYDRDWGDWFLVCEECATWHDDGDDDEETDDD